MKIILCSTKSDIRERWFAILADQGYSLYQASSMQVLEPLLHRQEQYLLLVHQHFTNLQTISTLSKTPETLKIFVLSDSPSPEEGLALLLRGVVGYANTFIAAGRLVEAMKTIKAGRVWFEQEIINRFIQQLNRDNAATAGKMQGLVFADLTEREKEIALLIAEGMSNQRIGDTLFISERTVKAHLVSIFRKTGAKNRVQLAMMIQRQAQA